GGERRDPVRRQAARVDRLLHGEDLVRVERWQGPGEAIACVAARAIALDPGACGERLGEPRYGNATNCRDRASPNPRLADARRPGERALEPGRPKCSEREAGDVLLDQLARADERVVEERQELAREQCRPRLLLPALGPHRHKSASVARRAGVSSFAGDAT